MNNKNLTIVALSSLALLIATTIFSAILGVMVIKPKTNAQDIKPLGWQFGIDISNINYTITKNAEDEEYVDITTQANIKNIEDKVITYIWIDLRFDTVANNIVTPVSISITDENDLVPGQNKTLKKTNKVLATRLEGLDKDKLPIYVYQITVHRYI